jgi:predicted nucleic acid-binding Zn ribbon protein
MRAGVTYPGNCEFCGKPLNQGKRFCSPACRNRLQAQQTRETWAISVCPQCGKEFHVPPSETKRGRKCCSRPCYVAHRKAHADEYRKVANKVCKNCGKDFTIPFCWEKKFENAGQYCSRECFHDYSKKNGTYFGDKVRGQGTGTFTDAFGYVHEYDPIRQKYIRQHRLVMERMLGRPLEKGEKVHHKNGKRDDNRPENLELILGAHFSGKRVKDVYARDIERLALENHKLKQRLSALEDNAR